MISTKTTGTAYHTYTDTSTTLLRIKKNIKIYFSTEELIWQDWEMKIHTQNWALYLPVKSLTNQERKSKRKRVKMEDRKERMG